jgi:hypothetical protein
VCFVVVDPQLLVSAYEFPHSPSAKLHTLFIYGRTCAAARGLRVAEAEGIAAMEGSEELDPAALEAFRARADRARRVAVRRRALLEEEAFERLPPDDLLLVMSSLARAELVELARHAQGNGRWHVHPDKINRLVARWTAKELPTPGQTPRYLDPDRPYRREYLIHTAIMGEADSLITEDELLRRDGTHSHPTTRQTVRLYSLVDFVESRLTTSFSVDDFDEIDAPKVFEVATRDLGPE